MSEQPHDMSDTVWANLPTYQEGWLAGQADTLGVVRAIMAAEAVPFLTPGYDFVVERYRSTVLARIDTISPPMFTQGTSNE